MRKVRLEVEFDLVISLLHNVYVNIHIDTHKLL